MSAILFFVPLLAGYIFANTWQLTKYRAAREDSQRLYFLAAFYGIFIAVCAFLSCMVLLPLAAGFIGRVGHLIIDLAPLTLLTSEPKSPGPEAIDVGLMACFLGAALFWGCTLGMALNQVTARAISIAKWIGRSTPTGSRLQVGAMRFAKRIDPVLLAIRDRGDDIEHLLVRAVERTMPIQVTLNTRKVYVGDVVELVEPQNDRKTLRLLPLLSGYRDENDFSIAFTTSYTDIYEQVLAPAVTDSSSNMRIEDFEIVVQLRDVVSINLFDFDTYLRFSEPSDPQDGDAVEPDDDQQAPGNA